MDSVYQRSGANIPCNLYTEYLNSRLKFVIKSMGANIKPATTLKAGKAICSVHCICLAFEEETTGHGYSDKRPFIQLVHILFQGLVQLFGLLL